METDSNTHTHVCTPLTLAVSDSLSTRFWFLPPLLSSHEGTVPCFAGCRAVCFILNDLQAHRFTPTTFTAGDTLYLSCFVRVTVPAS